MAQIIADLKLFYVPQRRLAGSAGEGFLQITADYSC